MNNKSTNGKDEENGKHDKSTNFKVLGAILVSVLVALIAGYYGLKFHYQGMQCSVSNIATILLLLIEN